MQRVRKCSQASSDSHIPSLTTYKYCPGLCDWKSTRRKVVHGSRIMTKFHQLPTTWLLTFEKLYTKHHHMKHTFFDTFRASFGSHLLQMICLGIHRKACTSKVTMTSVGKLNTGAFFEIQNSITASHKNGPPKCKIKSNYGSEIKCVHCPVDRRKDRWQTVSTLASGKISGWDFINSPEDGQ